MSRHVFVRCGWLAAFAVGYTLLAPLYGQPPLPSILPVASSALPASASPAGSEAPVRRFDPLDAHPPTTQLAMKSYLLGASWLSRMNHAQGRFLHGYLPAVRQPMEGNDELFQAHAARALARAAHFTGDTRHAAVASQAVLALLTATHVEAGEPSCRVPNAADRVASPVGFAAVLALSIFALPGPDARLATEAERLCEYLRTRLKPDGSIRSHEHPDKAPPAADPLHFDESDGLALQALAVSHRHKPAAWKAEAMNKALARYRTFFRSCPGPLLAATLTPAFAELYLQGQSPDAAAFVFEMNDWLCTLQYSHVDSRHPAWTGGFKGFDGTRPVESQPACESARLVESLAWACRLTRTVPDAARFAQYRTALQDGTHFVAGLQFTEPNTRHFENDYRVGVLIGGFVLSPTDGNLRIDSTAHAMAALSAFLESGAEKN